MRILSLDTSTIVASAAIVEKGKLTGEVIVNHRKKHSEKLVPMIDHLLNDCGMTMKDLDGLAVVIGPGSFTGLRIGLATIKGFAQALNLPVAGISTLESLAANLLYVDGLICPILDARRGQVFTGVYRFKDQRMEILVEASLLDIDSLIEQLQFLGANDRITFLGEGIALYGEMLKHALPQARIAAPILSQNRASSAGWLALQKMEQGQYEDYRSIEPVYIRPSYAEE